MVRDQVIRARVLAVQGALNAYAFDIAHRTSLMPAVDNVKRKKPYKPMRLRAKRLRATQIKGPDKSRLMAGR